MKKLVILAIATVFLLAACGKNKVDDSAAKEYIKKSKETISLFNEEKFDEMRTMFDATMKDALSVEQLQEVSVIVKESGEFVSFEKESIAKKRAILCCDYCSEIQRRQ